MRHISSIIIKSRESAIPVIKQLLEKRNDPYPGESFRMIRLSDDLYYILYNPGNYVYNSSAFAVAAEYFLLDDFIEQLANAIKENFNEFTLYGVIFSYLSHYFVVKKYTNNTFDGRALIDDMGEKITLSADSPARYLCKTIGSENEKQQDSDLKLFDIIYFLDELNLSWQDFEELSVRCLKEGEIIWPENIKEGKIEDEILADYPIIPMFDYLAE